MSEVQDKVVFQVTPDVQAVFQDICSLGRSEYATLVFIPGRILIYGGVEETLRMQILNASVEGRGCYRFYLETLHAFITTGYVEICETEKTIFLDGGRKDNIKMLSIKHFDEQYNEDISGELPKEFSPDYEIIMDLYRKLKDTIDNPQDYKWYTKNTDFAVAESILKRVQHYVKITGIQFSQGMAYISLTDMVAYFNTTEFNQELSISSLALTGLLKFTAGLTRYTICEFGGYYICIYGSAIYGWRATRSKPLGFDVNGVEFDYFTPIKFNNIIRLCKNIKEVKEFIFSITDRQAVIQNETGIYTAPLDVINDIPDTDVGISFQAFKALFAGIETEYAPPAFQVNERFVQISLMCKDVPVCFLFAAIHKNPYVKPEIIKQDFNEDEIYEDENESTNYFGEEDEAPW